MKKIITFSLLFLIMLLSTTTSYAQKTKTDFTSVIKDSGVDTDCISISIKNVQTGKVLYKLNDKILMNPASVQKILTTPAIYETLGEDYKFSTKLYQKKSGAYLLKLGADPYLTTSDIRNFVKYISKGTEKMYIDSKILDNRTWGEGWQWDDDLNPSMVRFGSYNLDKNLIKLTIMPAEKGQIATIINPSKYPIVFFNNIITSDKNDIKINRDNSISSNTLILSGTVARPTCITIPVNDLKKYFEVQLALALQNKNIYLKEPLTEGALEPFDKPEFEITHDILIAFEDVLKNSNNMVSETLFKLAGAKYCQIATGTDYAGIKMFNDFCVKNKIDNSRIRMVDSSGVSKNNLVYTDFVTDFLIANKDNKVMTYLPTSGEGTLALRLLPLKNNIKAKTGTLSDISSIAGYLTTKNGKKCVFCIITNDMKLSSAEKKNLEDYIIREAYLRL